MTLSHHVGIEKVTDHPDGQIRFSIRDRSLYLSVREARDLGSALFELANQIDPPPEPPVEVSDPAAEALVNEP